MVKLPRNGFALHRNGPRSSLTEKDDFTAHWMQEDHAGQASGVPLNTCNASSQTSIYPSRTPTPEADFSYDFCSESQGHSPHEIPKNILAFRTITTMLERVQRLRSRKFESSASWDGEIWDVSSQERDEARVSNAFASLAATDDDCIALVTRRLTDRVEVIAFIQDSPASAEQCDGRAIPAELEDMNELKLLRYLEKHCCKGQPMLATRTRLWILNRLLSLDLQPFEEGGQTLYLRLLHYVAATFHEKMISRFEFGSPVPYIQSLKFATDFQFRDYSLHYPSKEAIESDGSFLEGLAYLPFAEELKSKFPKIFEQADLAQQNKVFRLYTADTCKEFHHLLLVLLDRLYLLLQCTMNKTAPDSGSTEEERRQFETDLLAIKVLGHLIHRLTRGLALEVHIKTISHLLDDYRINIRPLTSNLHEKRGTERQGGQGDNAILQKSYMDWLKSIVNEFDAASTLVQYIEGLSPVCKNFACQILVSRPPDKALISWRELLTDANITSSPSQDSKSSSVEVGRLIQFCDAAVRSNCLESSCWAESARTSWAAGDLQKTIEDVRNLANSTLPKWREYADTLLCILQDKEALESETERSYISEAMDLLCAIAQFFTFLWDLDKQIFEFSGTLHCEACLVSVLWHFQDSSSETVVTYNNLSHVTFTHQATGIWTSRRSTATLLPDVSSTY
ncbi:hypothetical protein CVT26_008358 [Gymnopilus dilepis]|uniref:Uncharacterized protein n=1 Tax=Gymnopilus dilepis TaxID=231916 RepID=A0A409XYA6_9AGAR|nr:hypothetical protein CVT26_008358 [Gymnopilus dilepis]